MARNQQTTKEAHGDDGDATIERSDAVDLVLEEPILGTDEGPIDDPTNLGSLGSSPGLPDLGIGDDSPIGDLDAPGSELGSSLLDDLTGGTDVPDPTDGLDGMDDGWSAPVIDDPTGTNTLDSGSDAASGDPFDPTWLQGFVDHGQPSEGKDDPFGGQEEHTPSEGNTWDQGGYSDEDWAADHSPDSMIHQIRFQQNPSGTTAIHIPGPDSGTEQQDSAPPEESTPIPEEADNGGGTGDLDPVITGNVDPDPELEAAGGRGALIDTGGDVDPDPDLEDVGEATTLDVERAGLGAVDPLDEGASLLDGGGDLAEMTEALDLGGDIELDLDDSLIDVDLGQDI